MSVLLAIPTKGKSLEIRQQLDQISKLPKKQLFRKLAEEIDRHAETISSLLSKCKKEKLALTNTHKPLVSEETTGFSNLFEKKGERPTETGKPLKPPETEEEFLEAEPTQQAVVIIRRDLSNPRGFRVQTSFPKPENPNLPFED